MYLSFLSILCYAHVFPCYVHVHINVHIIHSCQYMYIVLYTCTLYLSEDCHGLRQVDRGSVMAVRVHNIRALGQ